MSESVILLVENSESSAHKLCEYIEQNTFMSVVWQPDLKKTRKFAADGSCDFLAAIVNCDLPNTEAGKAVQFANDLNLPVIALSPDQNGPYYKNLRTKNVFDTIVMDLPHYQSKLVKSLDRLIWHRQVKILVVDDNPAFCRAMAQMLQRQYYQVFEVLSGFTALDVLAEHPDISVMVVDYKMPEMDGFSLIRRVREQHPPEQIAIIGVSGEEDKYMGARFLEYDANDFICKHSFVRTEFIFRVNRCTDIQHYLQKPNESVKKDAFSGLYSC